MSGHCEECGDPVAAEEWHPVVTRRDCEGELLIRDFCSGACRSAWESDD